MSVTIGLSSNVNGDGFAWVCLAVTSSDMEIVGAIADVPSDHHRFFFVPLPVLWVGDINWIVMVAFRVIENEADGCVISILGFVCDPVEVDGAEGDTERIVLWEWG